MILWAQNPNQTQQRLDSRYKLGGFCDAFKSTEPDNWSWQDARQYYYIALTGRNFDGTLSVPSKAGRDAYFADTFRAVGQQMHIVQDASVPSHVRNDIHLFPVPKMEEYYSHYEYVIDDFRTDEEKYGTLWDNILSIKPVTFDKSLLDAGFINAHIQGASATAATSAGVL